MKTNYFQICEKVSEYSDHHQHKIGSLVAKKNKVLSTGFNKLKTHPLSPHPFKSCHAEFMAIKQLSSKDLLGATICIFRRNKLGKMSNARPCNSCMSLIIKSGIKTVCYTHETGIKVEHL